MENPIGFSILFYEIKSAIIENEGKNENLFSF